jgi:hypothetical protein
MKNKRGKKIKALIIILIILISLLALLLIAWNKNISGKAILNPTIPSDCSNNSIKSLWDSIFNEPSTDIQIFTNTTEQNKCNSFLAYKIKNNEAFILSGVDISFNLIMQINITAIIGIRGDFTNEYLNILRAVSNSSSDIKLNQTSSSNSLISYQYLNPRTLNLDQANTSFKTIFKAIPGNWMTNDSDQNKVFYIYEENTTETSTNTTKINLGISLANSSLESVAFIKTIIFLPSCTPNWQQHNATCNSSETFLTYYTDSNSCGINTSLPQNITQNCDFDNNGVLGNQNNFNTKTTASMHEQVSIYINGTSNLSSQNFTNQLLKVEMKNPNSTYLEFYWNFSIPLNLNNVYIEKQASGNKSYLLIKNINANKTIYLTPLTGSGKICVKNEEISSISTISQRCRSNNEILLTCPETHNEISCEIANNQFKIMGLINSGVIEYIENGTCIENWNYSSWSNCINNTQKRNATDLNYCGTTITKGLTTQSCGTEVSSPENSSCISSWNCSAWSECINDTQTKTCIDNNNCKPDKEQSQSCSASFQKITNYVYLALIATLIIAIIIILTYLIITYFSHSSGKGGIFSSSPIKFSTRSVE